LRAHKNAGEVLAFYRQIRMRYDPKLRIYLVADNLSTHKTPPIREWAARSNVELVFTPDLCELPQPHRVPLLGHR
jgi:transposase